MAYHRSLQAVLVALAAAALLGSAAALKCYSGESSPCSLQLQIGRVGRPCPPLQSATTRHPQREGCDCGLLPRATSAHVPRAPHNR